MVVRIGYYLFITMSKAMSMYKRGNDVTIINGYVSPYGFSALNKGSYVCHWCIAGKHYTNTEDQHLPIQVTNPKIRN